MLAAIRERKTVRDRGQWKSGKMPRTAFPLSKSHNFALGSGWRWRVSKAVAGDRCFWLLVAYEQSKAQYRAWLGLESGTDQALLARLEYHPSHRGWHCHIKTGEVAGVGCGVVKHAGARETVKACPPNPALNVSDTNAEAIAWRVFNVADETGGMFQ